MSTKKELLKKQESIKKVEDIDKNIVRLGALTKILAKKNQKQLDEISSIDKEALKLNLNSSKDLSKNLVGMLKKSNSMSMKDRNIAKQQLKEFKTLANNISNEEDKTLLNKQIANVDKILKSNSSIVEATKTSIGKMLPGLVGVVSALGASSPIVGLIAAKGVELLKERSIKKKQRKEEQLQHAIKMKDEQESLKKKIEQESNFKNEEKKRKEPSAEKSQQPDKEFTKIGLNNVVKSVDSGLVEVVKSVEKSNFKNEENRLEAIQQQKENTQAIVDSNNQSIKSLDGEVTNSKSIFSKFANIRVALFGLFTTAGSYISKFVKFLPKLLKKIPIIGAIISGGLGIFNEISALPGDATIGETLFAGIRGLANGIMDFFVGIPVMLIDFITGSDIAGFVDSEGGYVKVIASSFSKIIKSVSDWITGMWETVSNFVKNNLRSLSEGILGETATNYLLGTPSKEYKKWAKEKEAKAKKANTTEDLTIGQSKFSVPRKIIERQQKIKKLKESRPSIEESLDIKRYKAIRDRQALNIGQTTTNKSSQSVVSVNAPVNNVSTSKTTMVGRPDHRNTLKTSYRKGD